MTIATSIHWGGNDKGRIIQLTSDDGYVQLTLSEAANIAYKLSEFIKEESIRRQKLLRQQIENLKDIDKTVFKEIADMNMVEYDVQRLQVAFVDSYCPKHLD